MEYKSLKEQIKELNILKFYLLKYQYNLPYSIRIEIGKLVKTIDERVLEIKTIIKKREEKYIQLKINDIMERAEKNV